MIHSMTILQNKTPESCLANNNVAWFFTFVKIKKNSTKDFLKEPTKSDPETKIN